MAHTTSSSIVKFRLPVKGSFIAVRVMNNFGVPRTDKGQLVKSKANQTPVKFSHWCYGKVITDPEYAEDHVVVELHLRDTIDYKDRLVHRKNQKLTFDTYGKICSIDKRRVDVWYVMDRPTYESVMGQDDLKVTEYDIVMVTNKDCPIATYATMTSKTVDEELTCHYCHNGDAKHKKWGVMYVCSQCDKGYHKGCLEQNKKPVPTETEDDCECEEDDWLCWQCCTPVVGTGPSTSKQSEKSEKREQKRQKTQTPVQKQVDGVEKKAECHGCKKAFKLNPNTCRVVSESEKYCPMCTQYGGV
jgi:hypothetical protein